MISNRDIIIFNDDWGRFPSTLQHIARVLMKHNNRVFWVGSLGLRKPKISLSDLKRAAQKVLKVFRRTEKTGPASEITPHLIYPFVIPLHDYKIIRWLNGRSISKAVNRTLEENNAVSPIFVTSAPITDNLIGKLGESCSIFYCVDDYSFMEGAFKSIPELEKKLAARADGVFAVSDFLLRTRKSMNGETHFAPQGVDALHFSRRDKIAAQVKDIQRPVIGFFGLISEWIDLDVIYKCVKKYPEYSFLMIGKSVRDLSRFHQCGNFTYLGGVDYKELPEYASVFDVGIIPFELNEITIPANPLKLLEYFSLGIPVVSSDLPEVRKFDDLAFVSKGDDQFVEMIKLAVEDNTAERNQKRIDKAHEFSWELITEKIFDTVLRIETNKKIKKAID